MMLYHAIALFQPHLVAIISEYPRLDASLGNFFDTLLLVSNQSVDIQAIC